MMGAFDCRIWVLYFYECKPAMFAKSVTTSTIASAALRLPRVS